MNTPELIAALFNSPNNFLDRISALEQAIQEIQVADIPPYDEIINGRTTVFAVALSPAEGVLVTDPTNVGYTGVFIAGNGIDYDGNLYVMGNVVAGELKTGFTDTGTLYAVDAVISGNITATTGAIGGWVITATTLQSLTTNIGISLDSSVPIIRVGDTAGNHIVIDGANQRLRSSNFVTGATGFNISASTGDAEFNNITARGELRTFLLTSSNQMAVAGNILVSKDAGKLGADAASGATTVNFGKALTVGDWIKIQGPDSAGSNSLEWMLIGSNVSGTTYNVTRNIDGSGANNWLKDTPFVVIGADGDSRIELVAGATASLQLITQGPTWDAQTVQASMSTVEGAISAGNGAVLLNEDGILLPDAGDAIQIVDTDLFAHAHLYTQTNGHFTILNYLVETENNLLTNGSFETGSFSSWTETDPSSRLSVVANPDGAGYVAKFDDSDANTENIQQNVAATDGCIVTFRAKSDAGAAVVVYGSGGEIEVAYIYTEWRNFILIFDDPTTYLNFGVDVIGNAYIDNIVVREKNYSDYTSYIKFTGGSLITNGAVLINGDGAGSTSDFGIRGVIDYFFWADVSTERVGIKNNTPSYTLDVGGDINISSGSVFRVNGVAVLTGSPPSAETNANDLFRVDSPGGVSAFAGTIATLPGGATLTYNVSSGQEGAMVPTSTSQLAKMRLYNTTRGTSALISNCVVGTNTLTLTANVPGAWQVGDTITIASQTVSGGSISWVDLEITSGPTGKTDLFVDAYITSSTANHQLQIHPFETYGAGKVSGPTAGAINNIFGLSPLITVTGNVFSIGWQSGATLALIRYRGYLK